MEIRPASLAQVQRSKDGRMVAIDNDVQNVANDLHEIDPKLRLRFSEAGGYFVVYFCEDGIEGNGQLVLTAQDLDQRIVERIRRISSADYDYAAELEKADDQKARDDAWQWSEWAGETGEKLAHTLRKELGHTGSRAFIPKEIPVA